MKESYEKPINSTENSAKAELGKEKGKEGINQDQQVEDIFAMLSDKAKDEIFNASVYRHPDVSNIEEHRDEIIKEHIKMVLEDYYKQGFAPLDTEDEVKRFGKYFEKNPFGPVVALEDQEMK